MQEVADYIRENYSGKVIELGAGNYLDVAETLDAEGDIEVSVTDVDRIDTDLQFVRDDVRDPDFSIYEGAELVYSIRPPYELHESLEKIASEVGADLLVVPLGDEDSPLDYELLNRDGTAMYLVSSP